MLPPPPHPAPLLLEEKNHQAWHSKERGPHTSGRIAHLLEDTVWKKCEKRPLLGQGTTKWGPRLTGRGRNPGGKGPPALGAGPALYLASIVQGGETLGGGGSGVEGREQVLSPDSSLSPAIPNPNWGLPSWKRLRGFPKPGPQPSLWGGAQPTFTQSRYWAGL